MRLTKFERESLRQAFLPELSFWRAKLFLFGSRLHDERKGGDIDLLILAPKEFIATAKSQKTIFIDRIHSALGEQRIDLTFASPEDLATDLFLQSIWEQKVELA